MNGWLVLVIFWLVISALMMRWLWVKGSEDADLELQLLALRHELQRKALEEYKSALAAYFAGEITLGEANAAYAHYLKVCYGKEYLS